MEFVRKGRASKPKDAQEWQEYVKLMHEYDVDEWFINSCAKIKYMFPKAHAAAYVTSAFRIAWYKVHKPIVYYATYFSTRFDDFDFFIFCKEWYILSRDEYRICERTCKDPKLSWILPDSF